MEQYCSELITVVNALLPLILQLAESLWPQVALELRSSYEQVGRAIFILSGMLTS